MALALVQQDVDDPERRHLAHIRACREEGESPGQHDSADIVIRRRVAEDGRHLAQRLAAQCVAHRGTVERQQQHARLRARNDEVFGRIHAIVTDC